ncbi:charged multivesicular body protein 2b [Onthophagus taurus]|uniref:charged multivesicular body protein 2b n=1 Tax=Onthophagus taurus TaxID=166361 RepID=UPI000C20DF29|nr:charged multivesicular body protein 2b [Onthophagus taurus]XP_022920597.1 charged multivesicular body protein 2b [Onthophagus taurus]
MFNWNSKPNQREEQRKVDRQLRKTGRDLERDKRELEREEKKIELEIKRLAAAGNKEGCAILAKQLIQLRKQKTRVFAMNSKIQGVGIQSKNMQANVKLANTMGLASKTMADMNNVLNPAQVGAMANSFSKENMKMEMTEEMINDTFDDILNESDDEEQSDAIVNQVLDEIGIEISGKMSDAPSPSKGKLGESSKAKTTDDDILEQLAKLRN